jgi:hypothetical protein
MIYVVLGIATVVGIVLLWAVVEWIMRLDAHLYECRRRRERFVANKRLNRYAPGAFRVGSTSLK